MSQTGGGLRNRRVFFPQFWRLEIHDQGASKLVASEGSPPGLQVAPPYYDLMDFLWYMGTGRGREGEGERGREMV